MQIYSHTQTQSNISLLSPAKGLGTGKPNRSVGSPAHAPQPRPQQQFHQLAAVQQEVPVIDPPAAAVRGSLLLSHPHFTMRALADRLIYPEEQH